MTLGPLMLDISSTVLSSDDKSRLQHPLLGGVILFTRNYEHPQQLLALITAIRALRPDILLAVDHEGGRVQRFVEGFSKIPPMRTLGEAWSEDSKRGLALAEQTGWVLASELRAHGLDFSFTPVLDRDYGTSTVIGERAFHHDLTAISALAQALVSGMKRGGMAAVGKHFPGHGFVAGDTHTSLPIDSRSFADIAATDMQPFIQLIAAGLPALMPAHVIYENVDKVPAGFSKFWLQDVLRGQLGFQGAIFSDDLSMEAASTGGDVTERAHAALMAGCDMVLLCNQSALADELLAGLTWQMSVQSQARLNAMRGS